MNQKLILLLFLIFFSSCKSGLEKEYEISSKEIDLDEISLLIPKEQLELLKNYILEQEKDKYWNLTDKTYELILYDAKMDRLHKKEQLEKKKREDKIEKELLELRKKLLCNKEWKVFKQTYELESTDSIYSIGETKAYKDLVYKDTWKKYFEDGTYKEKEAFGGTISRGRWKFINSNEIEEQRAGNKTRFRSLNEPDVVRTYLKIKYINKSTFAFQPYKAYSNSNSKLITIMKTENKSE